jgi:hypothetical protein
MPVGWKTEPGDHDYPAASDYLALIADHCTAVETRRRGGVPRTPDD